MWFPGLICCNRAARTQPRPGSFGFAPTEAVRGPTANSFAFTVITFVLSSLK